MSGESLIGLANNLETARLEAMSTHGPRYQDKVAPCKDAIIRHMAATGMTTLGSTLQLAKTSLEYSVSPGLILAAGVELAMEGGMN